MNRESTFSLTIMVIIMAILAIFIGYLLGNWLIQLVTGDTSEPQQVVQKEIVNEETIEDGKENETINEVEPPQPGTDGNEENQIKPPSDENIKEQLQGEVFVIQVGAFNDYNNAQNLKEELEAKGFQVFITENRPYKVQVGATNEREEAEKTEEKLKSLGYNAFITH